MSVLKIEVKFKEGFKGELIANNGTALIGETEGTLAPYDMLLASLASCLYATFLAVMNKKRITSDGSDVIVTGEKRKEIPSTLTWVNVVIEIKNASNEKGVLKASEMAAKYCSIYQTLSKIAKMNLEVKFV